MSLLGLTGDKSLVLILLVCEDFRDHEVPTVQEDALDLPVQVEGVHLEAKGLDSGLRIKLNRHLL